MVEERDPASVLGTIIRQMMAAGVTELEVRRGNLRLRLRRAPGAATLSPVQASRDGSLSRDGESLRRVTAPLTGIFYAAPNPSSKPYVAVGDWVERDTVVGLIETMKVFNEVTADCRGRVTAILVQQGQLVHAGEPILVVDLAAAPNHAGEVTA